MTQPSKSQEISEYIAKHAALFAATRRRVVAEMGDEVPAEDIRPITTTIFLQTVRHFNL